jgi:hypothetical protein
VWLPAPHRRIASAALRAAGSCLPLESAWRRSIPLQVRALLRSWDMNVNCRLALTLIPCVIACSSSSSSPPTSSSGAPTSSSSGASSGASSSTSSSSGSSSSGSSSGSTSSSGSSSSSGGSPCAYASPSATIGPYLRRSGVQHHDSASCRVLHGHPWRRVLGHTELLVHRHGRRRRDLQGQGRLHCRERRALGHDDRSSGHESPESEADQLHLSVLGAGQLSVKADSD